MASYYQTATPTSPTASQPSFGAAPPPPPPKPSSHDPSRTSTPSQVASPSNQHTSFGAAPPVPPSPSHAHALDLQQQRQYQQTQQQQYQPHPLSQQQQQQQQQPPVPSRIPQQHEQISSPPPPSHLSSSSTTIAAPSQHPPRPTQQQHDWLPPSLPTKSTLDLTALINSTSSSSTTTTSPSILTSLSRTHPSHTAATHTLQTAISQNLELAQQVSALERQVRAARDQTASLMLTHASLQGQWRRKQGEMEGVLAPWGPRGMYQRLVAGIGEQEAVLRAVHESFLEGGGGTGGGGIGAGGSAEHYGSGDGHGKASEKEVTEWIKRIREGTTILEKRREMRARWDEGRVGGWR